MPTTINNVETLAAVPHILNRGAAWYKALCLGNPKSTGTKLISICGHVQRPGNYEVTMGTPMKDILYDMAGGPRPGRTFKAVIPGGSSVPIMTREEAEAALFDYEGIVEKGSMLGSAGMIVMDDTTDMVYQIWRLARFYAHESCAQCTQCREGTAWTTKILERILAGKGKQADFQLLLDLSENMTGKTICVLSDSCAAPVVSGIQKFRGEFEAYIAGRASRRWRRSEVVNVAAEPAGSRKTNGRRTGQRDDRRHARERAQGDHRSSRPPSRPACWCRTTATIRRCRARRSAACAWSRSRRRPS